MGEAKVFVRKASGLVREVNWAESMLTNYNGVGTIWLAAFSGFFIYYAVPQADIKVGLLLVYLLGVAGYLSAYAMLTASWPRAGAPYVAESRILHPSIGFMSELGLCVSAITSWGIVPSTLMISWGLIPGTYAIGLITNNQGLINLSSNLSNPVWMTVIGTLFYAATVIPAVLGIKKMVRHFQIPVTIISLAGVIAMIGILAFSTHGYFVDRFTTLIGQSPDQVIAAATKAAPDALAPVIFTPLVVLMGIGVLGSSTNTYWNAWTVGEMKDASSLKKQLASFNLAGLLCVTTQVAVLWLEENVVSRDFMVAATQLSVVSPTSLSPNLLYGGSIVTFIPMLLSSNGALTLFLTISTVAASLSYAMFAWLPTSRVLFSISFDGALPSAISKVSSRFRTPVYALLIVFLGSESVFLLSVWAPWLTTTLIASCFAFGTIPPMVAGIALAVFPLKHKYYDMSPIAKYKIGIIPVATIVGLIGAFSFANNFYWLATLPQLGWGGQAQNWSFLIGVFAVLFVLYWVIYVIRKAQGIDLSLAFREVPPA